MVLPRCAAVNRSVDDAHIHARAASIGEEVEMVLRGAAEDLHHAGQGGLGAGAHVQWRRRQPHGVDADQRSSSHIQAAHASAAPTSHVTATVVEPRRTSMRMGSPLGAGGADGAGIGSAMKPTGLSLTSTASPGG
jgi:hypothetical protein